MCCCNCCLFFRRILLHYKKCTSVSTSSIHRRSSGHCLVLFSIVLAQLALPLSPSISETQTTPLKPADKDHSITTSRRLHSAKRDLLMPSAFLDSLAPLNEHFLANKDNDGAEQTSRCSGRRNSSASSSLSTTTTTSGQPMNGSLHSDPALEQRRPSRVTLARTFWEEHCVYLPAMLGWFLFSALLSAYNKVSHISYSTVRHYSSHCP